MINSVEIKGYVVQTSVTKTGTLDGWFAPRVRKLLVWYEAPLASPTMNGDLPPITEVMEDTTIESLARTDNENHRWKILWDKEFNLGWCVQREGGTAEQDFGVYNGREKQDYHVRIDINKMTTYADRSTRGSPGGHWSSDSALGRVNTGLLVMYTQYSAPILLPIVDACGTRIYYTG